MIKKYKQFESMSYSESNISELLKWIREYFQPHLDGWALFMHSSEISLSNRDYKGMKIYSDDELIHIFFNDPEKKSYLSE